MKIVLTLLLLTFTSLFANKQRLSDIPAASITYIDLETEFCNEACLKKLINDEQLISFITRFDRSKIQNEDMINLYMQLTLIIQNTKQAPNAQIAIIIPQKTIKSYTNAITKSLIAYTIRANLKTKLKFISSDDETANNIQKALNIARMEGIKHFIAPLTQSGLTTIESLLYENEIVYIPTIHRSFFLNSRQNLVFGGVDYVSQIGELLNFSNSKITAFSDGSLIGNILNEYIKNISNLDIYQIHLSAKDINLKNYFARFSAINNSSIFLNLPTIKSSLIATQLKTFEIKPYSLLSTQINYNPKIINLVRQNDRQNLYIANSIEIIDDNLESQNALLGIDLRYNWLSYSSSIGLEYLANLINGSSFKFFKESVENNQVVYGTNIFKTDNYGFLQMQKSESLPTEINLQ